MQEFYDLFSNIYGFWVYEFEKLRNYMEVLHPNDVRNEMIKIIKGMGDEYAGVSRRDCKKKVPSVKELKALL